MEFIKIRRCKHIAAKVIHKNKSMTINLGNMINVTAESGMTKTSTPTTQKSFFPRIKGLQICLVWSEALRENHIAVAHI